MTSGSLSDPPSAIADRPPGASREAALEAPSKSSPQVKIDDGADVEARL
ncbi:MAG TPA: hypothetical protein VG205_07825 [Acidimicrobiales bacterium]|nr:hypothetical protein [Acidimicrobiales bacterium]